MNFLGGIERDPRRVRLKMASNPPFHVEDQTDEDFFDKRKTILSHPLSGLSDH